jgi:hypothetical protein
MRLIVSPLLFRESLAQYAIEAGLYSARPRDPQLTL